MKLFFDSMPILSKLSGIPIYSIHLVKELSRLYPEIEFYTSLQTLNPYYLYDMKNRIQRRTGVSFHCSFKLIYSRLGVKMRFPEFIAANYDVVHMPSNICWQATPMDSYENMVITLHDMFPFHKEFPLHNSDYESFILENIGTQLDKGAAAITVSEFSRTEINKFTGIAKEKIHVIPIAVQGENETDWRHSLILKKLKLESNNFFLAVGTLRPHKNYPNLIRAFNKYRNSSGYSGQKMVIVGNRQPDDSNIIEMIGKSDNIILLNGISKEDLYMLYHNACGFFMISFLEGFGIPLLEAMSCGCPACYSRDTALEEIGRGTAFRVDPYSVDEISDMFQFFAEPGREIMHAIAEGRKIASEYSWKKVAENTMSVYRHICGKSS